MFHLFNKGFDMNYQPFLENAIDQLNAERCSRLRSPRATGSFRCWFKRRAAEIDAANSIGRNAFVVPNGRAGTAKE
ncbi:hypothetical protein EH240_32385 [Mesorhizobium tamadayense]|uniref:Uncharacterized protein n=1 Tax=Mesorhizobium tamadayense TaxID=425306 RepID=A0A3P3EYN4_9HYPH|nr:hypothetical protein [Mesorhizobium tamadayense]RRH91022.1 hypothetical protein EH240_32385 [Mesorhizobium tamadayense]